MSYANPTIPAISNPIGLDAVIQSLQEDIYGLAWVEKSFGRAWTFNQSRDGGRIVSEPKAYAGEGEYHSVLPNDHLTAQSFIAVKSEETWTEFSRFTDNNLERKLSIILWFNLKELDENKDYIHTEELKKEVQQVLKANQWVKSIDAYVDERAEAVFEGYQLAENSEYLMYPYSGFRFDITVNYYEDC